MIADNLALLVDELHHNYPDYNSGVLLLGVLAFAIQIYADFSGYSDIARGCAQLLGFKLSKNFYFPYFSTSLKQFWQRWHISLSTWFRDYVYIPLGGNHTKRAKRNLNLLITFMVSGLWHGANYTFILWGFFHGFSLIVEKTFRSIRLPKIFAGMVVFLWVSCLFTMFRSPSLEHFIIYMESIFSAKNGLALNLSGLIEGGYYFIWPCLLFVVLEITKVQKQGLSNYKYNIPANTLIILSIGLYAVFENAPRFIYFQF